jgi:hypothetical protein
MRSRGIADESQATATEAMRNVDEIKGNLNWSKEILQLMSRDTAVEVMMYCK